LLRVVLRVKQRCSSCQQLLRKIRLPHTLHDKRKRIIKEKIIAKANLKRYYNDAMSIKNNLKKEELEMHRKKVSELKKIYLDFKNKFIEIEKQLAEV